MHLWRPDKRRLNGCDGSWRATSTGAGQRSSDAFRGKWDLPQAGAGGIEDGIADGSGHDRDGSFARSGGGHASAIQQHDLSGGYFNAYG